MTSPPSTDVATPAAIAPASPKARRRWRPRIGLRGLMLLVLVIGGGLGWEVHRARVRREAVETIRRNGSNVSYDLPDVDGLLPNSSMIETGRAYLAKWLGPEFVGDVERVSLGAFEDDAAARAVLSAIGRLGTVRRVNGGGSTAFNDTHLAPFVGFSSLEFLSVRDTGVRGPGLAHLVGLPRLDTLDVHGLPFDEEGLRHLARLVQLSELDLSGATIDATGFRHLGALDGLDRLNLTGAKFSPHDALGAFPNAKAIWLFDAEITDASLSGLSGLSRLEYLDLSGAKIGDDGIRRLARLPRLWQLFLSKTRVSNAGVARLVSLPALVSLHLDGTRVDDGVIDDLIRMKTLRFVSLYDTHVTGDARDRLRQARPELSVEP